MSDPNEQLQDMNDIIKEGLKTWEEFEFKDQSLWESFRGDFNGVTEDGFKLASIHYLRKLRDFLRKHGVWVQKGARIAISRALYNVLQDEELTPWTETEVKLSINSGDEFDSGRINRLFETDFGRNPEVYSWNYSQKFPLPLAPLAPPLLPSSTGPSMPPPTGPSPLPTTGPSLLPAIGTSPLPATGPSPLPATGPSPLPATGPSPLPATGISPLPTTGPASTTPITTGHGRELSNLAKMYTDETKYSGENDSFAFKLTIFHDICARADVPQEAKLKVFPTMLKGLALDYYYSNVSISGPMTFDEVCWAMKSYFEGTEYRRSVLSKWNGLTLKWIMSQTENEGKTMEECFQLLIKELRHLQHGLDPELRTEKFIHNRLINACQEIPACQYACFKPSDTLAGLINNLQSSIVTFQKANSSEAFFTDRRYHKYLGPPRTN